MIMSLPPACLVPVPEPPGLGSTEKCSSAGGEVAVAVSPSGNGYFPQVAGSGLLARDSPPCCFPGLRRLL